MMSLQGSYLGLSGERGWTSISLVTKASEFKYMPQSMSLAQ